MAGRMYVWLGICMYMTEQMYVCMAKHMYECMAERCVSFYELLLQHLVEVNSSLVQSIRLGQGVFVLSLCLFKNLMHFS